MDTWQRLVTSYLVLLLCLGVSHQSTRQRRQADQTNWSSPTMNNAGRVVPVPHAVNHAADNDAVNTTGDAIRSLFVELPFYASTLTCCALFKYFGALTLKFIVTCLKSLKVVVWKRSYLVTFQNDSLLDPSSTRYDNFYYYELINKLVQLIVQKISRIFISTEPLAGLLGVNICLNLASSEPCRTPQNAAGVCVDIKDCSVHLDYLVNKRWQPGVKEYLQAALCYKQGSQVYTCCPIEKRVSFETNKGGSDCQTPRESPGRCVNIRKCNELLDLLVKREQTEYLKSSLCGFENRDPKVCCPLGSNIEQPKPERQPERREALPGRDVCGVSDFPNNRVVNGQPAALGSWPWMVALGYRSPRKPLDWLCGGSLISDRYVVTAAHCITNIGSRTMYVARLGDLNLDDKVADRASPIDVPVERAIAHENYNAALHTVDIGLVKLKNRVQYSNLIRPICLPAADTFGSDLYGYSPFVVGWGATAYRGPTATHLQEAQIDITDLDTCSNAYRSIKGATIDDRVICALSPGGQDACQGDSGGPLILPKRINDKINFYLLGVVSYGYKCAEPGYPGIYSKVALYVDWIKKNMS
ncbi:serine-type endopeptidase activity protein [Homalodisca vitripennis]|nr:serine-type endopeptidase activity protein [Homalodisca vitripennis]